MKIKSLLLGMLVCSSFVACTNEETPEVNNNGNEKGEKAYMAVNLVTPNVGSRAADEAEFPYKDGTGNEVTVGSIRFYFFGDGGSAYAVTDEDNTAANFIEVKNPTVNDNTPADDNVNKVTSAVLVINKSKVAPPKSVVAILNADNLKDANDELLLDNQPKTLSALTAIVGKAGKGIDGQGDKQFVMTNSVYKHAVTGETMVATPISISDIFTNKDDAEDAPVDIYVERVVAKVSANLTVGQTLDTGAKFGDKQVYAQINGWAITNYNDQSYLFKSLADNSTWNFGWTWNAPTDFRSFWASSVAPTQGEDYNANYKNDHAYNTLTSVADKYCLENTNQGDGMQTQLLVAATLVTKNGEEYEPLTFARWMGVDYTVDALKTQLAGTLAYDFYYKESETNYKSITDEYIDFANPDNTWDADEKRYEVKATLAKGKTVYMKNEKNEMVEANDEANTALAKYPVWIWTGGATYYYVPIKHIGAENAIVRNHLYDINVTGVTGFGTPVYDPTEIILPQKPEGVETYIAAQVNILSWRVVKQTVTLE